MTTEAAARGLKPEWLEIIRSWARAEPHVLRVWVFGSRAKGTHRSDSDLDIAYTIAEEPDSIDFGTAICLGRGWREALQSQLPVTLQLEYAEPDQEVVWPAVQDHGVLIYEAER